MSSIVAFHQHDLVAGNRALRQRGHHGGQGFPGKVWNRHEQPSATKLPEQQLQERLVRVGSGPAQLVDPASRSLGRQRSRDRFCDIAHVHRLQLHSAGAEQWQDRHHTRQRGQLIEEGVLRPEHHARAEDGGPWERFFDQAFADGAGTDVW